MVRAFISPWQPQDVRAHSWETDHCSCNEVDPSNNRELFRTVINWRPLHSVPRHTRTRHWQGPLMNSHVRFFWKTRDSDI